ncbi:hypothetical protein [Pontibacter akesuensis]|uniref:Fasciclin domain-containing protein n=1 Tax=Pontibacter akesuensis TaxID=388950 RepID=A0A1I7J2T0_9BACT|nr:hypothetical protein [Pontibacter akesuensis]GHA72734.1 hypothetical protein GCM10007389_28160 [Pontibacter akesuensis]SFU79509.1 hypothetical protein SAMN04487941_2443 [Pontibacter akesuensis]
MKKKVILLLLVLTGVIPIACCPDPVEGPYNFNLYQLTLLKESFLQRSYPGATENLLQEGDAYAEDTLILSMNFEYLLAQHSASFSLQPAALALSCGDDLVLKELKDKVESITVTSNKPFRGVPAGQPLNSFINAFERSDDKFNKPITLNQLISRINSINGHEFMGSNELSTLAISGKPADAQERTFTVHITYKSNKEDTVETYPITW